MALSRPRREGLRIGVQENPLFHALEEGEVVRSSVGEVPAGAREAGEREAGEREAGEVVRATDQPVIPAANYNLYRRRERGE
eukprot:784054-Pyramimonas_sp.AAC.1